MRTTYTALFIACWALVFSQQPQSLPSLDSLRAQTARSEEAMNAAAQRVDSILQEEDAKERHRNMLMWSWGIAIAACLAIGSKWPELSFWRKVLLVTLVLFCINALIGLPPGPMATACIQVALVTFIISLVTCSLVALFYRSRRGSKNLP